MVDIQQASVMGVPEVVTIDDDDEEFADALSDNLLLENNGASQQRSKSPPKPQDAQSSSTGPNNNTSLSAVLAAEPTMKFGPYVPILRSENGVIIDPKGIVDNLCSTNPPNSGNRLDCEILPDDAILEAPSLITPLLLKKRNKWPPKEPIGKSSSNVQSAVNTDKPAGSDEVQGVRDTGAADSQPKQAFVNHRPVEDYVKSTAVASLTQNSRSNNASILTIEDYYKSSVGEMLIGIGLSRVREYHLQETAKKITSKIRRNDLDATVLIENLESLRAEISQSKLSNKPYEQGKTLKCPLCQFKTEFSIVLDGHLETPHVNNKREYICNWCDYKIKDANQIVFHNLFEHKKRCRIEKPLSLHLCRFCPFECKSKRRIESHTTRCSQFFSPESLQGPADYGGNDFPAVTSKLITQQDVKSYEQTLRALRLAAYNPHQIKVSGSQQPGVSHLPLLLVSRSNLSSNNIALNPFIQGAQRTVVNVTMPRTPIHQTIGILGNGHSSNRGPNQITSCLTPPVSQPDDSKDVNNSAQILHLLGNQNSASLAQNKCTIIQNPKAQSAFSNGKSVLNTASEIIMAPNNPTSDLNGTSQTTETDKKDQESASGQSPVSCNNISPKGSTFVICEICDGYIKDLNQLKSHMQWIHKVKIHQKTLESRPPLSCQKCQWRFFTDQGLERHLLGAHALVTSNMQEQVDKGTDSGRCTVCGRAYANKLVAHMKDAHKSNLKPAHLSYKCTVCSATFNLYRLFENHVYSVHSDSVRRTTA